MDYYNIEGNGDLARDPYTNSIVNVNKLDYEHYVEGRKAKEMKNQRVDSLEKDLSDLKGEINEIKSLLKELVHGN
jgi:hypothetical protein